MTRISTEFGPMDVDLCEKCGTPVYARTHPALRMCPRHAHEHLSSLPPFACTQESIDEGYEPSEEKIAELIREQDAQRATVTTLRPRAEG